MAEVTEQQVQDALRKVNDPFRGRDLVSLGAVRNLSVCGNAVKLRLELPGTGLGGREQLRLAAEAAVRAIPGVATATVEAVEVGEASPKGTLTRNDAAIKGFKHIVAIASGKGGVGKSTLSANLAVSLARRGRAVGLMDVDVYGPSIPGILGVPRDADGKYAIYAGEDRRMIPPVQHGIKVISLGFFTKDDEATVVRGPILTQAVRQFLQDVTWGDLDYLICDLPPGTGDIPLSLAQMVPLTGAVIVATPQDVALKIAAKSIAMFEKLRVDVLGIVENMSYFMCPHCATRTEIFSHGGARKACDRYQVPFLGEIPLDLEVRVASDAGRPIAVSRPDSPQAKTFDAVTDALEAAVARADARRAAQPPPLAPVTFVKTQKLDV